MSDPVEVLVARLEVWIETVLNEIKRINEAQEDIKGELGEHAIEISQHEKDKEYCNKKLDEIIKTLQAHAKDLPTASEIQRVKDEVLELKMNVRKNSLNYAKLTGIGSTLIIISGIVIGILKYFKVI